MAEAVIVAAVRSPHGRRGGALSPVHPVDLAATVLQGLVDSAGVEPAPIGDVSAVGSDPVLMLTAPIQATGKLPDRTATGCRYGPQTMCEGGGTADATLVELVA